MKTIGIDCRLGGIQHAGIGRYVEELVRCVIKDTSIQWVLFVHDEQQFPWLETQENIRIVLAPIGHYTLKEQIFMYRIFSKENLDLLHVPHFNIPLMYTKNIVVTIHDLLWHEQKGAHVTTLSPLTYALKYQAYTYVTAQAIKRAKAVIVPAQTVKDTIKSHYPNTQEEKVIAIYEGVDEKWFKTEGQGKSMLAGETRVKGKEKVLFYTGSLYPHKNVMRIVEALQELPDYELYISSSRNVFTNQFLQAVADLGLASRVHHLGRCTDEQLRGWYTKINAFVQPSLSEGFGLPALEAMACGVPVIASDIPIFHEIYKDAFIAFDPHSTHSLVAAIQKLEDSDRKTLGEKGISQAKKYSWNKMGQETLQVYKNILGV